MIPHHQTVPSYQPIPPSQDKPKSNRKAPAAGPPPVRQKRPSGAVCLVCAGRSFGGGRAPGVPRFVFPARFSVWRGPFPRLCVRLVAFGLPGSLGFAGARCLAPFVRLSPLSVPAAVLCVVGWRLRGSGASAHKVPPPPRAFPP